MTYSTAQTSQLSNNRQSYLQHLADFDRAIRANDTETARNHLAQADVPSEQIDAIINRIQNDPSKYGYQAAC